MKKTERLVFFYDLTISADSRTFDAPKPISVKRALELVESVPTDSRIKDISNGREQLYISDWRTEGDTISILVNKSDKGISDPVFTIPKEKKRRTAEKKEKEGQDFSAHIIIRLPKNELSPALAMIEHCNGLGISTVQKLLNQVINNAKKIEHEAFEQNHPDGSIDAKGQQKKYNVTFKFEFEGHISDSFKHDLDNGKVQYIELITEKDVHSNIDEDGYIQEKCKTLVLTLKDQGNPIANKFNIIRNALSKKKDIYNRARIKFKTPTGIDRTIDLDVHDAAVQGYVRKEKLEDFDFDLKSSYDKFCDQILVKMQKLLIQGE